MLRGVQHRKRKANRGPAAAGENRSALLAAAREVFSERGFHVPLSAIAKKAGVGQGVLYRHFSSRIEIAFAVFEDNWAELEALGRDEDPNAFGRLWRLLIEKTIEERAFIEMIIDARRTIDDYDGDVRLKRVLAKSLKRAQDAGLVSKELRADDVMAVQRLVLGMVVTSPDGAPVRKQAARALSVAGLLPPIG